MHINIKRLKKKANKNDLDIITEIDEQSGQRAYIVMDSTFNEELERCYNTEDLRDCIDDLTAPFETIFKDGSIEIMGFVNLK